MSWAIGLGGPLVRRSFEDFSYWKRIRHWNGVSALDIGPGWPSLKFVFAMIDYCFNEIAEK